MSIDVDYFSFSPSRADKNWPHFIEDIFLLRKKHVSWDKYEKAERQYQEEKVKTEASFKQSIDEIRKKIFDHFDNKGYIIPWIEWDKNEGTNEQRNPITMTDEDKMEYLRWYGCVYPRSAKIGDKNIPCLLLGTDVPELKEAYEKIIKERDNAISQLPRPTVSSMENQDFVLNKHQSAIDAHAHLNYLIYENNFDHNHLIFDLKMLDIHYGSVRSEYFEEPKSENILLDLFIGQGEHKLPDNKNELLKSFQNITPEIIQEKSQHLMRQTGWNKNEAESIIKDYLRSVGPAIEDLKETQDAIFIRFYGGNGEVEPVSAESLLLARAKNHAEKYKGLLPPVL